MDANIHFVGRWDQSRPTLIKSYWGGAYFRVHFTGTTVRLKLASQASLMVSIDGQPFEHQRAEAGVHNLTPIPLLPGLHSLVVAARGPGTSIEFRGLMLDEGAETRKPEVRKRLIEFVGDSITEGGNSSGNAVTSYGWLTGEQLNADHTQIAKAGICLQSGCYSCNVGFQTTVGMDQQFLLMEPPGDKATLWDFSTYQADLVVINLGTNDNSRVKDDAAKRAQLREAYIRFVQQIRSRYPNSAIMVMRTFGGYLEAETKETVSALREAGDPNVHYVDTTGWLDSRHFAPGDGVHPITEGHRHAANKLAAVLKKYL